LAKILLILALIILGLVFGNGGNVSWTVPVGTLNEITTPHFAIAFYFVSYSYFGWNAAAYIISELKNPGKNVPRSLFIGTAMVTLLYVLVNFVFMYTIPFHLLEGKIEIGYVFGERLFGGQSATIIGLVFSFLLLATISAMILTGPRVTHVIGKDYKLFNWFARANKYGIPQNAIIIQGLIAIVYVLTSTFEQMITYMGFTLNLFTTLTVAGLFLSRNKHGKPKAYSTVGYPVVPAVFILINCWILAYGLLYKPLESMAGIGITLTGAVFYLMARKRE
jgi:APA family basic amino acid/polyamine antiporter